MASMESRDRSLCDSFRTHDGLVYRDLIMLLAMPGAWGGCIPRGLTSRSSGRGGQHALPRSRSLGGCASQYSQSAIAPSHLYLQQENDERRRPDRTEKSRKSGSQISKISGEE